jgi:hypothetical protein
MDANEPEKIEIIRRLQTGTKSRGGTKILIAAKEHKDRKEVKISADYTDYADFDLEADQAVSSSRARPRVAVYRFLWKGVHLLNGVIYRPL